MVGGELQASKINGLTCIKSSAGWVVAVGNEGEFRLITHQNIQRKACYKCPFLARQLSVFSAPTNNRMVNIVCSSFEVIS
jgi:hypothetical protein